MQTDLILPGRLHNELVNSCGQIPIVQSRPLKERSHRVLVRIPVAKVRFATLILAIFFGGGPGSLNALAERNVRLTVTAVGDVRITGRLARSQLDQIRKIKLRGDVVVGNFEGALCEPTPADPWMFSMPLESIALFRHIGFNTLGLANNHSMDLGIECYQKTLSLLVQSGFWVAGGDGHGIVAGIRNLKVRIVGFSFSGGNNVNDLDAIPATIGKKENEMIIISAHMGGESPAAHWIPNAMEYFGDEKRGDVVQFSHRCVEAGADLVLGHGPHVPRGLELYHNKLIVYSLGNFVFDYPGAERNAHAPGYSISIYLDENGNFSSAVIRSYDLQQGVPVLDGAGRAYRMIEDLTLRNLKQDSLVFPGRGVVQKRH